MYRLGLNQAKSNNYMFFDFEAPLCLSVSQNTGVVERLTPGILSAIKSGTLILLEGELPKDSKSDLPKVKIEEDKIELVVEDKKSVSTVTMDNENQMTFSVKQKEDVIVAEPVEEPVEEPAEEPKEQLEEIEEEEAPVKKKTTRKPATKKTKAE